MKKKIETVKAPRRRRSNLEMAGFSREHLRIIKRISDMSQVSLSRVGMDVIEIGMAAVVSKYQPMIEMEAERKERTEKLKDLFNNESSNSETIGQGIPEKPDELVNVQYVTGENSRPYPGVTPDLSSATLERPGDDALRSGHEPETNETPESIESENDVVFGS